jgi:hypothetical protein
MQQLEKAIEEILAILPEEEKLQFKNPEKLVAVYPFNKYEYVLATLLSSGKIDKEKYLQIRDKYISRNKYLSLFDISAPRNFGETWAQNFLKEKVPEIMAPTKKNDSNYSGEYDFYYKIANEKLIKIEVKASRAIDAASREYLGIKALETKSDKPFDMNFQQIKPKASEVFVWIGVWRDTIKYWVLSSGEVENNKYYSVGQHRGNIGEGQLHLKKSNENDFKKYEVKEEELLKKIIEAYNRQITENNKEANKALTSQQINQ